MQLEQNLSATEREVQEASRRGLRPDVAVLEKTISDPSIALIRKHSDLLSGLHDSLDESHAQMVKAQQQALHLGVISWISVLLAAWVIGLLLAWRMGDRLLNPLVQLELVMRRPPQQVGDEPAVEDQAADRHEELGAQGGGEGPAEVASVPGCGGGCRHGT